MQGFIACCFFQSLQKAGQLQHGQQGSEPEQEDRLPPAPVSSNEEQMKQAEDGQKQRSEVVRIEQANAAQQQTGLRTPMPGWPGMQHEAPVDQMQSVVQRATSVKARAWII